jgi:DHA3 family macrolide efflux protein-like MFS transporter
MEGNDLDKSNIHAPSEKLPTEREKFVSFIFLLIGQLVSLFGSSIVMFSIILWITLETESAPILSITSFLSYAPVIILIPFTGVYADRWNKKKIVIISDLSQAIFTLVIIILFYIHAINLAAILILIVLRGIGQAFHQPALTAIIPFMVPQKYLSKINSIAFLLMGLLNIISPIIASFLMTFLNIRQVLWIDIITFSIALVPSIFLKLPVDKRKRKKKSKFVKDFKEGLLAFRKVEGLISLLLVFAGISFFSIPFYTLVYYYIIVTRSGTSLDLALVMAFYEIGIVAGAIVVMIKRKWNKYVLTMIQLMYFQLLGVFFYLLAPEGAFLFLSIGPLILGFGSAIINSLLMTLIQTIIPPRKQGRAMSILIVITSAVTPLGMILSGFLADLLGIYLFFWLCVILMGVIVTLGVLFTKILNIDKITREKMNLSNDNDNEVSIE